MKIHGQMRSSAEDKKLRISGSTSSVSRASRKSRKSRQTERAGHMVWVNHRTWHRFGGGLASQFELRERMFYAQYWDVVSRFQNREYDQYDTPAASYLVWLDGQGKARGCVRLSPTDRPYMIKDNWPKLCSTRPLPDSLSEWEMTRLCVDDSLPEPTRLRIKRSLVCALLEFGLMCDVRNLIGVMAPKFWGSVFTEAGCALEFVGKERILDGEIIRAAVIPVTIAQLARVRLTAGIDHPVLENGAIIPRWLISRIANECGRHGVDARPKGGESRFHRYAQKAPGRWRRIHEARRAATWRAMSNG